MNLNAKSANNNNATNDCNCPSGKTSMRPPHSPGLLETNTQEIPVEVANLVSLARV